MKQMKMENMVVAAEAFHIESICLLDAFTHIDRKEFSRAVDCLSSAQRIAASGCGHSGIACMHFAHLMCCIERPARFISPSEALHGGLGFISKGDVLLLASRGGKTDELLAIQNVAKKKGATIIAVTENTESTLAKNADVVIKMFVSRETDKYNSQGTTSNTVLNVIFDALQAAVIEEIGYEERQFALVHPGGAVGERLRRITP